MPCAHLEMNIPLCVRCAHHAMNVSPHLWPVGPLSAGGALLISSAIPLPSPTDNKTRARSWVTGRSRTNPSIHLADSPNPWDLEMMQYQSTSTCLWISLLGLISSAWNGCTQSAGKALRPSLNTHKRASTRLKWECQLQECSEWIVNHCKTL